MWVAANRCETRRKIRRGSGDTALILKKMRILIYPKDVAILLGYSEGHARRIYRKIKNELQKEKKDKLSIVEFCNYMNLSELDVRKCLNLVPRK